MLNTSISSSIFAFLYLLGLGLESFAVCLHFFSLSVLPSIILLDFLTFLGQASFEHGLLHVAGTPNFFKLLLLVLRLRVRVQHGEVIIERKIQR
jgi:hypothetical protein